MALHTGGFCAKFLNQAEIVGIRKSFKPAKMLKEQSEEPQELIRLFLNFGHLLISHAAASN